MNTAFVITTYQQTFNVEQNIKLIRSYQYLGDSHIIVVYTSYTDPGFSQFNKYKNIDLIHFANAPGNPGINIRYDKPNFEFRNWRQEFLPPRILMSIQLGCRRAMELKYNKVVHIHSDSFYTNEEYLIEEINAIDNKLLRAEIAPNEYGNNNPPDGRHFQYPLHFHPESLIINLQECLKLKPRFALDFDYIYNRNNHYKSRHWGGTEAMVGQFAMFCLNGSSPMYFEDDLPNYNKLVVRKVRDYHGSFDNGFVNLGGEQ